MSKLKLKNSYLIYSLFLFYFLFSQIHPFLHFHADSTHSKTIIHYCFHPRGECSIEHEGCEHNHEHHEQHANRDHLVGKFEHLINKNKKTDDDHPKVLCIPLELKYEPQLNNSGLIFNASLIQQSAKINLLTPSRSPPFAL